MTAVAATREYGGDANGQHCPDKHLGQFVDVGADAGHQFTAVQPHRRVDWAVGKEAVDTLAGRGGCPQRRVV